MNLEIINKNPNLLNRWIDEDKLKILIQKQRL